MSDPAQGFTLDEAANMARANGRVVLGMLTYDVEHDQFLLAPSSDMEAEEIDAILRKHDMFFMVGT